MQWRTRTSAGAGRMCISRTIRESKLRWRSTPPGAPSSGCCWTRWRTATGWGWCAQRRAQGSARGELSRHQRFHAYGGTYLFHCARAHPRRDLRVSARRHHYGTTGNRLHLDVRAHFAVEAQLYPRDPMVESVAPLRVHEAIMGDIVKSDAGEVELSVEVVSTTPIEGGRSGMAPRRSRCTALTPSTNWVAASGSSGRVRSVAVVRPPPAGKARCDSVTLELNRSPR